MSFRRKQSQEETTIQHANLTEEQTAPESLVPEDEKVHEQEALEAGHEAPPTAEGKELGEAVQDLSAFPELPEAAQDLSGISEPPEVEPEPTQEEAVTSTESQLVAELSEQVRNLIEEKESLFDRLLRKQSEFENFRKRTEKEKQEFYEFALSGFVQTLLPVLDGLERSLSAQEGETVESYRKGNELILKQFRDQLWLAGTQPIRSMGKIFDPNYHQAVMREESSILAENEIIEEYQRGYLFKDRLLRPSMVKVAVAPSTSETDQPEIESHEGESPAVDETATEG